MSSPTLNNSPSSRQSLPSTPSTPLQTISLEASLQTHGSDTSASLSPADCRTLKKILQDVRTASPRAPQHVGDRGKSLSAEISIDSESSASGREDEVQYSEKQYDYGDEAEEGYEDEDDSMDLSDVVEEVHYADGDTIEDIMNLPGRTASPAPSQDFSSFYHHNQATPEEIRDIKLRRASIEKELEDELLAQQHGDMADQEVKDIKLRRAAIRKELEDELLTQQHVYVPDMEGDTCDYISAVDGFRDDALHLSDDPEFRAVQEIQAEIGMSVIADEEAESELEVCEEAEPYKRPRTIANKTPVDRGI